MTNSTLKVVDKKSIDIGVQKDSRAEVAEQMSTFLASTYTLYMKTLYYHWNVTGPNFHGLHTLFESQYQDLQKAGDAIAERIRALGHFTPGTYREFTDISAIAEDNKLPSSAGQMIENLLQDHETLSKEARKVSKVADVAGDEVTTDMMVSRMTVHDEAAWMLRSSAE